MRVGWVEVVRSGSVKVRGGLADGLTLSRGEVGTKVVSQIFF